MKRKNGQMIPERMKASQEDEGRPGFFLCAVHMFSHSPNDASQGKETWQTLIEERCCMSCILPLAQKLHPL